MQNIPPTGPIQLDLNTCDRKVCKSCGEDIFSQEFKFFVIPEMLRFAAPPGHSEIIAQVFVCKSCGEVHVNTNEMKVIKPKSENVIELVK
jgi:hypothetical protein